MDTRRLLTMMMICFAIIFGWQIFVEKVLYPRHPEWKRPGQATTAPTTAPTTTATSATTAQAQQPPESVPQITTTPSLSTAALRVISPATQPSVVTIGDETAHKMIVRLATAGAGLESVTLHEFKGIDAKSKYVFQTPYDPADASTRALATRSINVNGINLDLAGVQWNVEAQSANSATFALDLGLVRIRKIYELTDSKSPAKGYELSVRHVIENRTQQPANVIVSFAGPVMPPRENVSGPDQQLLVGYDGGYEKIAVTHNLADEFTADARERDVTRGPDNVPLVWAGTSSVYFEALVKPAPLEQGSVVPKHVGKVIVTALAPDAKKPQDRRIVIHFTTSELKVEPGSSLDIPATTYLGPRWRKVLNDPYYDQFPRDYDATLVLTSGPCGWCTFQFLINGLVWLLNAFQWVFGGFADNGDWGLAIIALVVLVRVLLHPITKRSQISMLRMGKMGPEMERLKKKYADDKDELNKQMMLLYKEQGIGPYLGCLPMFLQMPIWIALWSALQSTFELRQAPFLWGYTWIDDLAKPDHLITFAKPLQFWLPLFGDVALTGVNILPIVMGGVFYLQMKLTPQPPSTTPEQEMQKKMMLWMSVLLFPLFLYNGPSGLNLYILTSTCIGIVESKRIRAHIKQKEEEEKAGKIIVDAPRGMKKKRDDDDSSASGAKRSKGPQQPKGGLAGWFANIQSKAEEIRRQGEKDRK